MSALKESNLGPKQPWEEVKHLLQTNTHSAATAEGHVGLIHAFEIRGLWWEPSLRWKLEWVGEDGWIEKDVAESHADRCLEVYSELVSRILLLRFQAQYCLLQAGCPNHRIAKALAEIQEAVGMSPGRWYAGTPWRPLSAHSESN